VNTLGALTPEFLPAPRRKVATRVRSFLIVDADEKFRASLANGLRLRGLVTYLASSQVAALESTSDGSLDAAIVDIATPRETEFGFLDELTLRHPDIRIVTTSACGCIATAVEAVRRGAIDYLLKPLTVDQVLSVFESSGDEIPRQEPVTSLPSLARIEWEHIQRILHDCGGNISLSARRLGIHRRSLQRKLGKLPPSA
jgi:two-component system response regulator RegA